MGGELTFGLGVWLFYGSIGGFSAGSRLQREVICAEKVRFSGSRDRDALGSALFKWLFYGLLAGLVFGLVLVLAVAAQTGSVPEMVFWLHTAVIIGLTVGLVGGLGYGLAVGLVAGLSFGEIETRALPNEGIHRSARQAVVVGLLSGVFITLALGLAAGLAGGLIFGLIDGPAGGLVFGLILGTGLGAAFGLFGGCFAGLKAGGGAFIKHFVLRLWLIRSGSIPLNYVKFLDFAADRMLLRKVGGGYMFIHRMLLEWFAERCVKPGESAQMPARRN